ncbi:hypothetical protein BDK51DRAFT_43886 [Blyttiomyces helicus]|uniref:CNH domain-containing protein n=1 Tax=Blyttiomyces helicus TaxID=388810 RepID=A0A4P9WIU6_9FUNG|nr:hypothetical protein BDK51DRAFT_43886 [Blyttiomyces helicus]|eukprot:RKO91955.1 hypothetical protein BDK51DRAFT_43886 [Blyttiomyces helicus]
MTSSFTPFRVVTLARDLSLEDTSQQRSIFGKSTVGGAAAASGSNAQRAAVEAVELCGTSDGHLMLYVVEPVEGESPDVRLCLAVSSGRTIFPNGGLFSTAVRSRLVVKKYLGLGRRAVERILAIPTESKLVVMCGEDGAGVLGRVNPLKLSGPVPRSLSPLSHSSRRGHAENSLSFYDLDTLAAIPTSVVPAVKAITSFCADRTVSSPLSICIAKRRVLLSAFLGDTLSLDKEISLPDGAIHMVRKGAFVCAADQQQYKLIDVVSGATTPLFPYDRGIMRPVITVIGDGEFLLAIATPQGVGLGIFITSRGDAIRGR